MTGKKAKVLDYWYCLTTDSTGEWALFSHSNGLELVSSLHSSPAAEALSDMVMYLLFAFVTRGHNYSFPTQRDGRLS